MGHGEAERLRFEVAGFIFCCAAVPIASRTRRVLNWLRPFLFATMTELKRITILELEDLHEALSYAAWRVEEIEVPFSHES